MTATERLRKLLTERGVEWTASGTDTCWTSADGYPMRAWDTTNGTHMRVADLTPEQAIAATLGAGTRRNLACHKGCTEFMCSECGAHYLGFRFSFCPHCGARIEVDE